MILSVPWHRLLQGTKRSLYQLSLILALLLIIIKISFVRCVKPNPTKTAGSFDKGMVLTQLKYSGMLETVRIRKAGFGSRMSFIDFYDRY